MTKLIRGIAAFTLFGLVVGCGGKGGGENVITQDTMLTELKMLLTEYQKTKNAPPKKLADLNALEPSFPAAVHALSTGKCVYVWGAGLSGGTAVVAYEKDVAEKGGPVLLQNGEVKAMTAEAFKAAPKAK